MRHPQAIDIRGVKLAVNASKAAWEHIGRFQLHQRRAPGPIAALRDLDVLEDAIEAARIAIVKDLRADGAGWDEIGEAVGMTASGARTRYMLRGVR